MEDEIRQDMEYLTTLWEGIKKRSDEQKAPALIYEEPSLHIRVVRDLLTNEVKGIIADSEDVYREISSYFLSRFPELSTNIELYRDQIPLFVQFGIEPEIKRIFEKKVWLKSGGHLIIEEAEALTVIDINTGRYLSGNTQEETIFKINMEAASEAARQIRLRNLVGIIVIDFIDLKNRSKREEVFQAFIEALRKDKARSALLEMSSFGVVQMTRQRVRESLLKSLSEPCGYCGSVGYVKSKETSSYEIIRKIKNQIAKPLVRKILVRANPEVVKTLSKIESECLKQLGTERGVEILFEPKETLDFEDFDVKAE
jgi:ribonuclease G